jgi:Ca2+-binding RTX toxin-like protein
MRLTHLLAILPAVAAVAVGPASANAALPKKCSKDGVCFTKTFKGADITIHVEGTAGDDKIVVNNKAAFGNNSRSHVSINGVDTQVDSSHNAILDIKGLGGNDQISMPTMSGTNGFVLYGRATLDGGDGQDVITGANRADVLIGGLGADILDGGAGNDQLFGRDGATDVLKGGLGTDAAESDTVDSLDAVEAAL